MKTVYIVGGVAIAGGALWYLATRKPAAPPPAPLTPGVSGFDKFCRPLAGAALQAGAASQGAPPTATAGIATAAAPLLCDWYSTVGKVIGKGAVIVAGAVATGATEVAAGVSTASIYVARGVSTAAGAVEHAGISAVKAPVSAVTTLATSVGSLFGAGSSKLGRAPNGKDVFPNDVRNCRAYLGVDSITWQQCGAIFDTLNHKWPGDPWPA